MIDNLLALYKLCFHATVLCAVTYLAMQGLAIWIRMAEPVSQYPDIKVGPFHYTEEDLQTALREVANVR